MPDASDSRRGHERILLAGILAAVTIYVGSYVALRAVGTIRISEWVVSCYPRVQCDDESGFLRGAFWPLWKLESAARPPKGYASGF